MDSLKDILKVLIEKRLIPALIGVAVGIVAYVFTPEDSMFLVSLGREWYILGCSIIAFLIVTFAVFAFKQIQEGIYRHSDKQLLKKSEMQEELESIEQMWGFIDSLRPEEKKFIRTFLKNGNKPVAETNAYRNFYSDIRDNGNYVKKSEILNANGVYETYYVLEYRFYNNLMYSMKKYGKISHFDSCEEYSNDKL